MGKRHSVRCIEESGRNSPEERISRLGGTSGVGVNWRLTQADAIIAIESQRWDIYVEQPDGQTIDVVVATTVTGTKYLKATVDGVEPITLLALPPCK